jgi:hypothetical protein
LEIKPWQKNSDFVISLTYVKEYLIMLSLIKMLFHDCGTTLYEWQQLKLCLSIQKTESLSNHQQLDYSTKSLLSEHF